jgi:hypothetical protein
MQLTISALKGVDDVEFSMSQEEVRARVGGKFRSFKRTSQASFPCDYFEEIGAFFYCDSEGRLEAVEFAPPARPTVMGVALLGLTFEEACANLRALDNQVVEEVGGAIVYQLGVSIYAPLAKTNPVAPVESVLAFRPGYYN